MCEIIVPFLSIGGENHNLPLSKLLLISRIIIVIIIFALIVINKFDWSFVINWFILCLIGTQTPP